MELIERRQVIKERHLVLESVGGSGWHRKDPNSPHMLDEMLLSERPIAFIGDDDVIFVGECAERVEQGLKNFAQRYPLNRIPADNDQMMRSAKSVIAVLSRPQYEGRYVIPRGKWNDCAYALRVEGIICCSTSLEEPPAEVG